MCQSGNYFFNLPKHVFFTKSLITNSIDLLNF